MYFVPDTARGSAYQIKTSGSLALSNHAAAQGKELGRILSHQSDHFADRRKTQTSLGHTWLGASFVEKSWAS